MARYRPQRQARVFACVAACVLLVGGLGPLVALLVSATLAALAGRLAYACTHPDDRRAQEHNRAARAAHERAGAVEPACLLLAV